MTEVKIYTDGSARGNPDGPGGYGVVMHYVDKNGQLHEKTLSAGYKKTTNNRMELMAAIAGLEALNRPCKIELYSDSKYLTDAFNKNWISALSEPTLLPPYFAGSNTSNLIKRLEEGHGGTKLTPQEIRKVSLWIDLLVPQIGDYREANNWSQHDLEYYDRYDKKRKAARAEEQENIRQYIQSLQTKQQK